MEICIFPKPKKIHICDGTFDITSEMKVYSTQMMSEIGNELAGMLDLNVEIIESPYPILCISKGVIPQRKDCSEHKEGYTLIVTKEYAAIFAADYAGAFYGFLSLEQIITGHALQCLTINDYPDTKMRGIHLDLKGATPSADYLKKVIKHLGRCRINTILMEYEDKFPYTTHHALVAENALTRQELSEVLEIAKKYAITVIPLLQCLGHTEYILRKKGYEKYAEGDNFSMLCPKNDEVFELFKSLATEIMEFHKDSPYFHIGADEARALGLCDKCKSHVDEHGIKGLFAEYLRKIIMFIDSKGYKSIMWDDMLYKENAFDIFKDIKDSVVMNLWEYDADQANTPYIRWKEYTYVLKKISRENPVLIGQYGYWIEDLEYGEQELLKKYKNFDSNGMGDPFPWAKKYAEYGYEVIGAAAIKGAGPNWHSYNSLFTEVRERYRNISHLSRAACNSGMTGIIATAWSRYSGTEPSTEAMNQSMRGFAGAGALMWDVSIEAEAVDYDVSGYMFNDRVKMPMALRYIEDGLLENKLNYFEASIDILESIPRSKNGDLIDLYLNIARFYKLKFNIEFDLSQWESLIYYKFEKDSWRLSYNKDISDKCKCYLEKLNILEEEMVGIYSQTMSMPQSREYVMTKTMSLYLRLNLVIGEMEL